MYILDSQSFNQSKKRIRDTDRPVGDVVCFGKMRMCISNSLDPKSHFHVSIEVHVLLEVQLVDQVSNAGLKSMVEINVETVPSGDHMFSYKIAIFNTHYIIHLKEPSFLLSRPKPQR